MTVSNIQKLLRGCTHCHTFKIYLTHKLGKITHYAIDLVLISIILAGVHRNTGLVLDTNRVSTANHRRWLSKYLAIGEACYENLVSLLRNSSFFHHISTRSEGESEPSSKQSQQSSL